MAIALALLAAAANALATICQRLGVEATQRVAAKSRVLIGSLLHRPVWIAGLCLATASFLLQALALSIGDLSTVQPIMVTELLFLVLVLGVWFRQHLGWREWVGSAGAAAGLGVFLALSYSRPGDGHPTGFNWMLLLIAAIGAVGVAFVVAGRGRRSWRAACYGVSAGIAFALTAAFIKTVAEEWHRGGVYVFTHPAAYAVAAAGFSGLVISQHALEAGPVAASQAALLIVNPLSSIVMGIWLFGDHVHANGARAIVEGVFLGVMFYSLILLSHSPLVSSSREAEQLSDRGRLSEARAEGLVT